MTRVGHERGFFDTDGQGGRKMIAAVNWPRTHQAGEGPGLPARRWSAEDDVPGLGRG